MKKFLICIIALVPLAASICEKENDAPTYSTDCKKCKEKNQPK